MVLYIDLLSLSNFGIQIVMEEFSTHLDILNQIDEDMKYDKHCVNLSKPITRISKVVR